MSAGNTKGRRVFVVGVGMTKFCKPQKKFDAQAPDYPEFGKVAATRALEDAKIDYSLVEAAAVGSLFGPKGQRCLYDMGMTGIAIHNVANACATGSNALFLGRQFVASGMHDCVLAMGVEKMQPGSLGGGMGKGATPLDGHFKAMISVMPPTPTPPMPQMFGNAAREHMKKYGTTNRQFAMIGEKNHRHSVNNPYSQFRDVYSLEQVEGAPMVHEPLTKLQCSPTSDGAACAILASEEFVVKHGLQGQAVEIIGQAFHTDYPSAFEGNKEDTCMNMIGFEMAKETAQDLYRQTGKGPQDVQVIELHDCFSANELLTYEAIGLCEAGKGGRLVEEGQTTYGGKWVVNPSGGLISKGHPIGATGLAQCCELTWQLRGDAGGRQVDGATCGLQHNLGLGGACIMTMYEKPAAWSRYKPKSRAPSFPSIVKSRL